MNFCKDCRYLLVTHDATRTILCRHPSVFVIDTQYMVTGIKKPKSAMAAREDNTLNSTTYCGPEARYYAPKL